MLASTVCRVCAAGESFKDGERKGEEKAAADLAALRAEVERLRGALDRVAGMCDVSSPTCMCGRPNGLGAVVHCARSALATPPQPAREAADELTREAERAIISQKIGLLSERLEKLRSDNQLQAVGAYVDTGAPPCKRCPHREHVGGCPQCSCAVDVLVTTMGGIATPPRTAEDERRDVVEWLEAKAVEENVSGKDIRRILGAACRDIRKLIESGAHVGAAKRKGGE